MGGGNAEGGKEQEVGKVRSWEGEKVRKQKAEVGLRKLTQRAWGIAHSVMGNVILDAWLGAKGARPAFNFNSNFSRKVIGSPLTSRKEVRHSRQAKNIRTRFGRVELMRVE